MAEKQRRDIVVRIASSRSGAWLFSRIAHHIDRPLLRWTNGRTSLSSLVSNVPVMTLETSGAKTGLPRSTPLVMTPDSERLILVASKWGQGGVPAWYHNLRATPRCVVVSDGTRRAFVARETSGAEREACWHKAVAYYPGYAAYADRVTGHVIPVLLLEPGSADSSVRTDPLKGRIMTPTISATDQQNTNLEVATLAGGCFWCLEAVFDDLQGVADVVSGYAGGHVHNPDYKSVCTGRTGHAEVVQVTFDPSVVSYEDVLGVFFAIHDPTTLNRQGADVGTQYRSAIYYHSDAQKATAEAMIAHLNAEHLWPNPIVTEVTVAPAFYPAEDYHQVYFKRNPDQGYCQAVVSPKLGKFRKQFAAKLKK